MMNDDILKNNIINLRESHDWSQAELARRVKMDNTALNKIEKGTRKVSSSELEAFSNVFGVSTDSLLGRKSDHAHQSLTLDEAVDSVMSYDGSPVTEHDRKAMKNLWKAYLSSKE